MAFVGKVGSVFKQAAASKHINVSLSASKPSIYQALRCVSSSRIFVGGLSYCLDETSLREAFSRYGEIIEAKIIVDHETSRSRGFGYISYTSNEAASSAIQAMDGKELYGRWLKVDYALGRPSVSQTGRYGNSTYGTGYGYSSNCNGGSSDSHGSAAENFSGEGGSNNGNWGSAGGNSNYLANGNDDGGINCKGNGDYGSSSCNGNGHGANAVSSCNRGGSSGSYGSAVENSNAEGSSNGGSWNSNSGSNNYLGNNINFNNSYSNGINHDSGNKSDCGSCGVAGGTSDKSNGGCVGLPVKTTSVDTCCSGSGTEVNSAESTDNYGAGEKYSASGGISGYGNQFTGGGDGNCSTGGRTAS